MYSIWKTVRSSGKFLATPLTFTVDLVQQIRGLFYFQVDYQTELSRRITLGTAFRSQLEDCSHIGNDVFSQLIFSRRERDVFSCYKVMTAYYNMSV